MRPAKPRSAQENWTTKSQNKRNDLFTFKMIISSTIKNLYRYLCSLFWKKFIRISLSIFHLSEWEISFKVKQTPAITIGYLPPFTTNICNSSLKMCSYYDLSDCKIFPRLSAVPLITFVTPEREIRTAANRSPCNIVAARNNSPAAHLFLFLLRRYAVYTSSAVTLMTLLSFFSWNNFHPRDAAFTYYDTNQSWTRFMSRLLARFIHFHRRQFNIIAEETLSPTCEKLRPISMNCANEPLKSPRRKRETRRVSLCHLIKWNLRVTVINRKKWNNLRAQDHSYQCKKGIISFPRFNLDVLWLRNIIWRYTSLYWSYFTA